MARIEWTSYKNSKLATMISFLSSVILYLFLLGAIAGLFGGQILAAVGAGAVGIGIKIAGDLLAEKIARRKLRK